MDYDDVHPGAVEQQQHQRHLVLAGPVSGAGDTQPHAHAVAAVPQGTTHAVLDGVGMDGVTNQNLLNHRGGPEPPAAVTAMQLDPQQRQVMLQAMLRGATAAQLAAHASVHATFSQHLQQLGLSYVLTAGELTAHADVQAAARQQVAQALTPFAFQTAHVAMHAAAQQRLLQVGLRRILTAEDMAAHAAAAVRQRQMAAHAAAQAAVRQWHRQEGLVLTAAQRAQHAAVLTAAQRAQHAAVQATADAMQRLQPPVAQRDVQALQSLLLPELAGLPKWTAFEDTSEFQRQVAAEFRAIVDSRLPRAKPDGEPEAVCCVCARILPLVTKNAGAMLPLVGELKWREVPAAEIPNKALLVARAPGDPPSEFLPRASLTTYTIAEQAYCLEPAGIEVNAAGVEVAKVCPDCWACLDKPSNKAKVPDNSLVRVDTGKRPDNLLPLTATEAQLLAPIRANRYVYFMKPEGRQTRPNDSFQRRWQGHVVAHPQAGATQLAGVFPPDLDAALGEVHVVFLKAATSMEDIKDMAQRSPAFQVRGPVIAAWARHFVQQAWPGKPFMEHITCSDANLYVLDNLHGVPPPIVANAAAAESEEEAHQLQQLLMGAREGYAATHFGSAEAAAAAAADAATAHEQTEGCNSMTGIDQFELQMETTPDVEQTQLLAAAAQQVPDAAHVLANGGILVSNTGRFQPELGDYQRWWPLLAFPECFPWGEGACPKGMSLASWVRLLLERHPCEQFARNIPFLLAMFNVLQRHQMNTQTHVTLRTCPHLMEAVGAATQQDVAQVLAVLQAGGNGAIAQNFHANASAAAKALLRAYRVTCARMPGSPQSFATLRSQQTGLWNGFGLYTAFVTLNPSPLSCSQFYNMVGQGCEFNDIGMPLNRPDLVERFRLVARKPANAAVLFHTILEAFQEVFMGWPPGDKQQANAQCMFGQILAWFNKHETTGRGDLHNHANFIQPDMQPARMLQHAKQRPQQLARFIEATMCRVVERVEPALAVDRNADPKPSAYYPPLDGSMSAEQASAFMGNVQLDLQQHSHKPTCAKNGGASNDLGCRVSMPRPTVEETSIVAGAQSLVVKCNNAYVAPHCKALLLAQPMNHAIWASVEASSFLRDHYIWAHATAAGLTKAQPPALLSAAQNAAEKAEYAAKYSTKPDNVNLNTPLLAHGLRIITRAHESVQERAAAGTLRGPWSNAQHVGLSKLRQATNTVLGSVSYPVTLVIMALLQLGDSNMSHTTVIHDHKAFAAAMAARVNGTEHTGETTVSLCVGEDGNITTASCVTDYLCRPDELEQLSPVLMTMLYFKRVMPVVAGMEDDHTADGAAPAPARRNQGSQLLFDSGHPQARTHHLVRRPLPVPVRLLSEPPVRPAEDATSEEQQAWGTYFAANFTAYRPSDVVPSDLHTAAVAWIAALGLDAASSSAPAAAAAPPPAPSDADPPDGPAATTQHLPAGTNGQANTMDIACRAASPDTVSDMSISACGSYMSASSTETDSASSEVADNMDVDDTAADPQLLRNLTWAWHDVPHAAGRAPPALLPLTEAALTEPAEPTYQPASFVLRAKDGAVTAADLSYLVADNINNRAATRKDCCSSSKVHMRRTQMRLAAEVAAYVQDHSEAAGLDNCPLPCEDDDWDAGNESDHADFDQDEMNRRSFDAMLAMQQQQVANHDQRNPLCPIPLDQMHLEVMASGAAHQGLLDGSTKQQIKAAVKAAQSAKGQATAMQQPAPAAFEGLTLRRNAANKLEAMLCVLEATPSGVVVLGEDRLVPPGGPLPFVPMQHPPSITEAIELADLNRQQALAFAYLADRLVARKEGRTPQDQALLLLLGGPGTGKSHVIKTLLWFAFQHDIHERISVTAYMWKAAALLRTEKTTSCSTSSFFAIDGFGKGAQELRGGPTYRAARADNLAGRWLNVFDEISFIGASHFNAMSQAAKQAVQTLFGRPGGEDMLAQQLPAGCDKPTSQTLPFGGLDVVAAGDLNQLPPVNSTHLGTPTTSILRGTATQTLAQLSNAQGREEFEALNRVFMLTEQKRIQVDDADGQQLLKYVNLFCEEGEAGTYNERYAAMAEFLDNANDAVVDDDWLDDQFAAGKTPMAMVTRHSTGKPVAFSLAQRHCLATKQRMIMWHAQDKLTSIGQHKQQIPLRGGRDTQQLQAAVDALPSNKTNEMLGVSYYFKGMRWRFTDSANPSLGHMTNNECVAEALILDPQEPPDDPSQPVRWLQHLPLAICVRPAGVDIGDLCSSVCPLCPPGCLVIPMPRGTTFKVVLRDPIQVQGVAATTFRIRRTNFKLAVGYAFTNYFCQGSSFGEDPWMADLTPPEDGHLCRAALYVILSRFKRWSYFRLLKRLWQPGDTSKRAQVIQYFCQRTQLTAEAKAEMQRLRTLAAATEATCSAELRHHLPAHLRG